MGGEGRARCPGGRVARLVAAAVIAGAMLMVAGTAPPVAASVARLSMADRHAASRPRTSSANHCSETVRGPIRPATGDPQMHIAVRLVGPRRTLTVAALIDTGASQTAFSAKVLRRAGFSVARNTGRVPVVGVVAGATTSAYRYVLPAASILVRVARRWVPLIRRAFDVLGVSRMNAPNLLAPDVLAGGARLAVTGTRWTLWPPCG